MAMGPAETLAYVVTVNTGSNGGAKADAQRRRGILGTATDGGVSTAILGTADGDPPMAG